MLRLLVLAMFRLLVGFFEFSMCVFFSHLFSYLAGMEVVLLCLCLLRMHCCYYEQFGTEMQKDLSLPFWIFLDCSNI